jgi:hypothetical protein
MPLDVREFLTWRNESSQMKKQAMLENAAAEERKVLMFDILLMCRTLLAEYPESPKEIEDFFWSDPSPTIHAVRIFVGHLKGRRSP